MDSSSGCWQATYERDRSSSQPAQPSAHQFLGMNVDAWGTSTGTPIIVWPWQGGNSDELWTLDDDDGHLIPGSCDRSMVTAWVIRWTTTAIPSSSFRWTPAARTPRSSGIRPAKDSCRTKSNQAIIGLAPGDIGTGTSLVWFRKDFGYATGFAWTQIPAIDVGEPQQWYFIQTALPRGGSRFRIEHRHWRRARPVKWKFARLRIPSR